MFQVQMKTIPMMNRQKMTSDVFLKSNWREGDGREYVELADKKHQVGDNTLAKATRDAKPRTMPPYCLARRHGGQLCCRLRAR
jgi:hypothetical protein